MRPPRVIIAGFFFLTTVFLTYASLRSSHSRSHAITTEDVGHDAGIFSFLSVRAPFSLFPPNAIITLTHDNTTAFLARPAAFGPSLPSDGLKGQLWIGSGFGDESVHQPLAAGAEGETGCGDVPGWSETYSKSSNAAVKKGKENIRKISNGDKSKSKKRATAEDGPFDSSLSSKGSVSKGKNTNDGTDDYLHQTLSDSVVAPLSSDTQPAEPNSDHADIQSIQEGAEIAGKVVLLSRGECGFLEKVKWAQRRGAIALIVGDNVLGGPLIQMYARGDTSNVTIPSIFTSRTTAHLLSSLMGPGSFIEDTIDDKGNPLLKVKHSETKKKMHSGPTFTPAAPLGKATVAPRRASKTPKKNFGSRRKESQPPITTGRPGWFRALFFGVGKKPEAESSRPPKSGQLGWVLVDDWKDAELTDKKTSSKQGTSATKGSKGKTAAGDDFVIGVQDWRDKDLITAKEKDGNTLSSTEGAPAKGKDSVTPVKSSAKKEDAEGTSKLSGGSITPGSGEYGLVGTSDHAKVEEPVEDTGKSKGLLNTIFGEDKEDADYPQSAKSKSSQEDEAISQNEEDESEGLWVTLTPTSGASPFLDTLLVLVVSPLVTLTVVYALLLIRSRIRRRRWRAPKSVVERLPVRTYQTIASSSSGTTTPRQSSSQNLTSPTVTTPLLQRSASPSRPRPRSRTTSGIPEPGDLTRVNSSPLQVPVVPTRLPDHEKNASTESEWKKYMGKQVECVVCLEEYVDGVSRVMSLPCGHEFHADCITPWLTTRRRTCPICKGDVVRSLARGSPAGSGPRYEAYHDDESDDEIQNQAAQTVNNSSSSALPISAIIEDEDIEQGISSHVNAHQNASSSWRNMLPSSWRTERPRPVSQEDRDR